MHPDPFTGFADGMFVTIELGWIKLAQASLSAFDGRHEDYPFRGYPWLLMQSSLPDEMVAVCPCGRDATSVWRRGPEQCFPVPHGLLAPSGRDFGNPVLMLPVLVSVVPRKAIRAWPDAGVTASSLTVPSHHNYWLEVSAIYHTFTSNRGLKQATERSRAFLKAV